MDSEKLVIAPLAAGDVEPAAVLLGRALCTNPMHRAVFRSRGRWARRRQERMFALVLAEFPGGRLVAKHDGSLVGVLRMVRSPACRLAPEEATRLGPTLVGILGDAAPRVAEWFAAWAEHDPRESHWHLGPIAVAVERQGHGIGSALLRRFCEIVDDAGEAACLETDKPENVRLYTRFGFVVRTEVDICGVNNYFMWRAAR